MAVADAANAAGSGEWDRLAGLNELLEASKAAPTLRRASRQQGQALLGLASGWPWSGRAAAEVGILGPGPWHHAVIFGALAGRIVDTAEEALAMYLQNTAAGLVAAAVRGVPIGHTHGQQVLARLQPRMAELAARWATVPLDCFGGFSPVYEELVHAQTQLGTRIFQS